MSKSVRFIIKAFFLLTYLIILLYLFDNHYFDGDECAARVYYYPLGRCDFLLIPLVGIVLISISLYLIHTSKRLRIIEVFIYASIIIATLLWGNDILASRTENWPERYSVLTIEKSVAKIMCENIEHKDYVFNKVEEIVQNNLTQETYSYNQWEHKTWELMGVETCDHSSDYEYLNHKCNILDYLNWHLIKKISQYGNDDVINGINSTILMSDSLLVVQYDLMEKLFEGEDLRFDFYGLALEIKSIINNDLVALYSALSNGTFEQRKITLIDEGLYECPSIDDDLITKEYQRFIKEYIPRQSDGQMRTVTQVKDLINLLTIEQTIWKKFIHSRNHTENLLYGKIKDAWNYNTKVWKLNKIRQLKNEFECYGTMSELDYRVSLQDCNYSELMSYTSFSREWDRITSISASNLLGQWNMINGVLDEDSFLSDTIQFDDDNMFYNQDTICRYTYHLELDTLFVHKPNKANQIFKVIKLSDKELQLEWIGWQFLETDIDIEPVTKSAIQIYYHIK